MADYSLAHRDIKCVPTLYLITYNHRYYDWEDAMKSFLQGRGLDSNMQLFFTMKTFSDNLFDWWRELHKRHIMGGEEPCKTWTDMKVVLRRRLAPPLESKKKKVAIVHTQNPRGTQENVRSSWVDSIAGNEYLPASNRQVVDINSHKKLGSGVSYGKSMHAEFVSSSKLKQDSNQSNYGEKLSACACSALGPKKKCEAAKDIQYVDNQKSMVPVKKLEAISSSVFSCAKPPERKYASSLAKIPSHPPGNSKEVAVAEKETKEKSIGPLIDIVDDASDGLSMMAKEIHSDGTVAIVQGQRFNIF
jgi:hypothetical protein